MPYLKWPKLWDNLENSKRNAMRRYLLTMLFIVLSSYAQANENPPNLLLIDSSFAPIENNQFKLESLSCFIISESSELSVEKGECYGQADWQKLKSNDDILFKGMMNTLAGIEGNENARWKEFNEKNPAEAKTIRNSYILSVHGSRSSFIAYQYSDKKAELLPVRVVTASAGTTKQNQDIMIKAYSANCPLKNWSKEEINQFHSEKKLQAYQTKISDLLTRHPTIKVISISLGYKKSWIQEDNAKCPSEAVSKEYSVLVDTWNNLFHNFKDRLFIVAAGNENANFDDIAARDDDLWATLGENKNLILVGSLKKTGERFPTSNYGQKVLMTKGEEIETISPLPGVLVGHKTTVRGTSFSTPIISGLAIKILIENPKVSIDELRTKLTLMASKIK